ncbi:Abi family protein [bacterium]|nr:Abi family protein [bacterium]
MILDEELEKYTANISLERLKAYIKSDNDTISDVMDRYADNIKMSLALYPELSILEVTLKNAIDTILRKYVSETWLEDEIKHNVLLNSYDYNTLIKTYNDTKLDCINSHKQFTIGKVIANLNFGFWTNLCAVKYSTSIWHKRNCYRGVFVNYPSKRQEIGKISRQLYYIRRLRNRVFHYEQIFKVPSNTLKLYNLIIQMISYLPDNGNSEILKNTSIFLNTYNQLTNKYTK